MIWNIATPVGLLTTAHQSRSPMDRRFRKARRWWRFGKLCTRVEAIRWTAARTIIVPQRRIPWTLWRTVWAAAQSASRTSAMRPSTVVEERRRFDSTWTVMVSFHTGIGRTLPVHFVVQFWYRIRHGVFVYFRLFRSRKVNRPVCKNRPLLASHLVYIFPNCGETYFYNNRKLTRTHNVHIYIHICVCGGEKNNNKELFITSQVCPSLIAKQ